MKTRPWIVGIVLAVGAAVVDGDWLVHTDGQRTEVRAFELGERAVKTVTLNGKPWSLLADAIDEVATRAANGMVEGELLSPSWPRPRAPEAPPTASEPTTETAPAPAPAPSPIRRPPPPPRVAPPPPRATLPPPAPTVPPVRLDDPTRTTRVAVFVNGVSGFAGIDFGESRTFEQFSESGSLDTFYQETTRPGYELGALVRVKGPFGVMASAELFEPSPAARYRAVVPHPYFYDQPRELAGEHSDLFRRELAVHLDPVVTLQLGSRLDLDLFGGVSLFATETDVIDEIVYDEVFPFESLAAGGATVRRIEDQPIGFNVGTSLTLRIASVVGVDFGVRYSRARTRLVLDDERELNFDAGGLRLGAGLRFLFP